MARQRPQSKGRFVSKRNFIENVALAVIGVQRDSPEFDRVVEILSKTLHGIDPVKGTYQFANPNFIEAIQYLPLKTALELFEKVDLEQFGKRWQFARELASQHNTFYSVPEWVVILEKFLEHQTHNEDSLLETGYPINRFVVSPWLDCQLGCLYFVKLRYSGSEGPIWFRRTGLEMTKIGTESDYSNADYMKFLNPERAMGSTRMVVEKALSIASQCLEKVNDHLTAEELHFLQEMDENYGWVDNTDDLPKHIDNDATLKPGGLADLLIVIGHVTGELAIRFKTDVRTRLRECNIKKRRPGILFNLKAFYQDYAGGSGQSFDSLFTRSENRYKEFKQYLEVHSQHASRVLEAIATSEVEHHGMSENQSVVKKTKLRIFQDDESVLYGDKKYCLPEKHFQAVLFIAEQHKKGNPSVTKKAVFEYCQLQRESMKGLSVVKWFVESGGHPERFANDKLIMTAEHACCRIPVHPDLIEIVPVSGEDSASEAGDDSEENI
jgi:hypothetical protein